MLAAHRAGIRHVVLPRRNEKDLKELPQGVKVSSGHCSVANIVCF